jgi:hypothetical protein
VGYDTFISYSSKNAVEADAVRRALEAAGLVCWMAPRDIRPGEEYPAAIMRGLGASRLMVLVFSADANASPQIVREVERAVSGRMPVLPFKIDGTLPSDSLEYLVSVAQWLDASSRPLEPHLAELVRNVEALVGATAPASPGGSRLALRAAATRSARLPRAARLGVAGVVVASVVAAWMVWRPKTADRPPSDLASSAGQAMSATALSTPPGVPLPDRLSPLPAEPVLRLAYESGPPPAAPGVARPHVRVGLLVRRDGQRNFVPLGDGDELASDRDQYLVAAQAVSAGWLYVFQVDSTGRIDWLYPKNDASAASAGYNPLSAGQTAQIPSAEARQALTLDRATGVEHIYFVYAASRWPVLEAALARPTGIVATVQGLGGEDSARVSAPNSLGVRGMNTRGVGGTAALTGGPDVDLLFTDSGHPAHAPGGIDGAAAGNLVVIERWFRHVP